MFRVFCILFFSCSFLHAKTIADFGEFEQNLIPPELILKTPAGRHWETLGGVRNYHGIIVPLFSLYSEKSLGIGEFSDLIPMIDWMDEIGYEILQLLPLNDAANSPYEIYSVYALDPIYMNLLELPGAQDMAEYPQIIKSLQDKGKKKRLQWEFVRIKKELFLKRYFALHAHEIQQSREYREFLRTNRHWLDGYALFKVLKRSFKGAGWEQWPDPLRVADPDALHDMAVQYADEMELIRMTQFLCFQQMTKIKSYATKKGIKLFGDMPFVPRKDSADVWLQQKYFFMHSTAGAPPDQFSETGQDWGLPVYNWELMKKDNYRMWVSRIGYAVNFYHIYRLDHAYGLFRVWSWEDMHLTLDEEDKVLRYDRGFFLPKKTKLWIENGETLIKTLLDKYDEFIVAEDLGNYEPEILRSIRNLGISGVRLFTGAVNTDQDDFFFTYQEFPPNSLTCFGTHDNEPMRFFWANRPSIAKVIADFLGFPYRKRITHEQIFEVLRGTFTSPSLLHLNMFNDYISMVPNLSPQNILEDRLNVPGTVNLLNWSFRYLLPIEKMVKDPYLTKNMIHLLEGKEFVPSQAVVEESDPDYGMDWFDVVQVEEDIADNLSDEDFVAMDQLLEDFLPYGNTCSPYATDSVELTLAQAIEIALKKSPKVTSSYTDVVTAKGELYESKDPFDPLLKWETKGIVSFDQQYPPFNIRTEKSGREIVTDMSLVKQFRLGTRFKASFLLDQNIKNFLPVYGETPIEEKNVSIYHLEIEQPLLKGLYYGKDHVQEMVSACGYTKAYYTYMDEISQELLNVTELYWDWVAAMKFVQARLESALRLQDAYQKTLDLLELNAIRKEGFYQIEGWFNQRKSDYIESIVVYNTALQVLKEALGLSNTDTCFDRAYKPEPVNLDTVMPNVERIQRGRCALLEQARNHRYDIVASRVDEQIGHLLIQGARNHLYPELNIFTDFTVSTFTAEKNAYNYLKPACLPRNTQKDCALGLRLSYPFGNHKAKGEQYQAQAFLQKARSDQEALQLNAESVIQTELLRLASLENAVRYARKSEEDNRRLVFVEGQKFSASSLFAYVEFERRLNDAINDRIRSQVSMFKALSRLQYNLGLMLVEPKEVEALYSIGHAS